MTERRIHFVVPGALDQRTGGYLYDAHMVAEMRAAGRDVVVHELDGAFPVGDDVARSSMSAALGRVGDDELVVVDGLAGGGLPEELDRHARRVRLVGLVHHPLADETGIPEAEATRLAASERAALAVCRGVVVTSRFTAQRLGAYGVAARRIGVAVPGTRPAPPASGPGAGAPPQLLCVGSLTPRKGHVVLVEALAAVAELEWTCAFAGSETLDPAHALEVRRAVTEHGLEGRVSFLGELDEASLDRAYAGASLFVLASYYEGYGMALTEAIVRGLPVLSTTGGAIPYTVPAEAGVLVEPGQVGALARALRSLLVDPDGALAKLRDGALRVAANLPDWPAAGVTFLSAVEKAGQGVPPGRSGAVAS
ncbi:MAG: glycosyltransferase family 4 protein [Gemmatimonadota bacterium]